jgi:hypothetical protein
MKRARKILLFIADFVFPTALYYGLRAAGVGIYLTVLISSIAPAMVAVYQLVRQRRVDGLALYTISAMALSAIVSLIAGSPRFLLAKDAWLIGFTGMWFLVSAGTSRPLAYLYSRPLLERRHPGNGVSWTELWEKLPRFRRIWRVASIAWGIGLLTDAVLRVVIAYRLPIDAVPGIGTAMYLATSVVILVITNMFYVLSGLFSPRSALYAPLAGARE